MDYLPHVERVGKKGPDFRCRARNGLVTYVEATCPGAGDGGNKLKDAEAVTYNGPNAMRPYSTEVAIRRHVLFQVQLPTDGQEPLDAQSRPGSVHPLYQRRRPGAVEHFALGPIEAHHQVERGFRNGKPVPLLVPSGRLGLQVEIERAVRVENELVAIADRLPLERIRG